MDRERLEKIKRELDAGTYKAPKPLTIPLFTGEDDGMQHLLQVDENLQVIGSVCVKRPDSLN